MRTPPDLFVLSSTPLAAAEPDSEEAVWRHDVVLVGLETVDLSAPTVRGWNLHGADSRGTELSREETGNILRSARLSPADFARMTDRLGPHATLGPAAPQSEGPFDRLMVRSTCGDALPEVLSWLPVWLWLPLMEHPTDLGARVLVTRLRRLLVGMVSEDIAESDLVQRIESLREVTARIGAPVGDPEDGKATDLFRAVERQFGIFSPVFDALLARREPAGALHARRRLETLFGELHKGGSPAIWGRRLAKQASLLDSTGEEVRSLLDRHPEWEPVARSLLDAAVEEGVVPLDTDLLSALFDGSLPTRLPDTLMVAPSLAGDDWLGLCRHLHLLGAPPALGGSPWSICRVPPEWWNLPQDSQHPADALALWNHPRLPGVVRILGWRWMGPSRGFEACSGSEVQSTLHRIVLPEPCRALLTGIFGAGCVSRFGSTEARLLAEQDAASTEWLQPLQRATVARQAASLTLPEGLQWTPGWIHEPLLHALPLHGRGAETEPAPNRVVSRWEPAMDRSERRRRPRSPFLSDPSWLEGALQALVRERVADSGVSDALLAARIASLASYPGSLCSMAVAPGDSPQQLVALVAERHGLYSRSFDALLSRREAGFVAMHRYRLTSTLQALLDGKDAQLWKAPFVEVLRGDTGFFGPMLETILTRDRKLRARLRDWMASATVTEADASVRLPEDIHRLLEQSLKRASARPQKLSEGAPLEDSQDQRLRTWRESRANRWLTSHIPKRCRKELLETILTGWDWSRGAPDEQVWKPALALQVRTVWDALAQSENAARKALLRLVSVGDAASLLRNLLHSLLSASSSRDEVRWLLGTLTQQEDLPPKLRKLRAAVHPSVWLGLVTKVVDDNPASVAPGVWQQLADLRLVHKSPGLAFSCPHVPYAAHLHTMLEAQLRVARHLSLEDSSDGEGDGGGPVDRFGLRAWRPWCREAQRTGGRLRWTRFRDGRLQLAWVADGSEPTTLKCPSYEGLSESGAMLRVARMQGASPVCKSAIAVFAKRQQQLRQYLRRGQYDDSVKDGDTLSHGGETWIVGIRSFLKKNADRKDTDPELKPFFLYSKKNDQRRTNRKRRRRNEVSLEPSGDGNRDDGARLSAVLSRPDQHLQRKAAHVSALEDRAALWLALLFGVRLQPGEKALPRSKGEGKPITKGVYVFPYMVSEWANFKEHKIGRTQEAAGDVREVDRNAESTVARAEAMEALDRRLIGSMPEDVYAAIFPEPESVTSKVVRKWIAARQPGLKRLFGLICGSADNETMLVALRQAFEPGWLPPQTFGRTLQKGEWTRAPDAMDNANESVDKSIVQAKLREGGKLNLMLQPRRAWILERARDWAADALRAETDHALVERRERARGIATSSLLWQPIEAGMRLRQRADRRDARVMFALGALSSEQALPGLAARSSAAPPDLATLLTEPQRAALRAAVRRLHQGGAFPLTVDADTIRGVEEALSVGLAGAMPLLTRLLEPRDMGGEDRTANERLRRKAVELHRDEWHAEREGPRPSGPRWLEWALERPPNRRVDLRARVRPKPAQTNEFDGWCVAVHEHLQVLHDDLEVLSSALVARGPDATDPAGSDAAPVAREVLQLLFRTDELSAATQYLLWSATQETPALEALRALRQEVISHLHALCFVLWPDAAHRRRVARFHLQPSIPYRNAIPGGALLHPAPHLRSPPMPEDPMRQVWVDLLYDRPPVDSVREPHTMRAVRQAVLGLSRREPLFFNVRAPAYRAADEPEWKGAETALTEGLSLRRDRDGSTWLVQHHDGIPWSICRDGQLVPWEHGSTQCQRILLSAGAWVMERQDDPAHHRLELQLGVG